MLNGKALVAQRKTFRLI